MVKLSPPMFYVEISLNFDITSISGRSNFISGNFKFRYIYSRIWKSHRFFDNYSSEKLSPPRKNYKIRSIFFKKLGHTKTKLYLRQFLRFRRSKFYPKFEICFFEDPCFDFFDSRLKPQITDQITGLRQGDILKF